MKKRFISMLTILAMCLTLLPTAALAEETPEAGVNCICTVLCDGEHINASCPVCGAEDTDLRLCQGGELAPTDDGLQEDCICTVPCAEGQINTDCPVCSVENADLGLCQGEAPVDEQVQAVQAQINALPAAEDVQAMSIEEKGKVYEALQTAYDAYDALDAGQKDQISGEEIFERLFTVLGGMIAPLEAQTGAFAIEGGTSGTNYTYADGVLTVKDGANITISMSGDTTTPSPTNDQIVVEASATATITLNGVNIAAPDKQSAIDLLSGVKLTLNLADNSTNTLTGGSGGNTNGAPGIHVPAGTALIIQGAGSLNVTGGASATSYGGAGIGGGYSQSGGDVIIEGGNVIATGGSNAAGIGGGALGDGGTTMIHGGTVTATGGKYAAGIGGGNSGAGGNITISGGNVTATGGENAAGIGGGNSGTSGTFSTGESGNAVIMADSIQDKTYKSASTTSGVIFDGDSGLVYGTSTLTKDFEIPSGKTLTVPENATLTVADGVTMINKGTITINGTLTNSGTIANLGGTIDGNITGNPITTGISYLDCDPNGKNWVTKICTNATAIEESTTTWGTEGAETWYVASDYIVMVDNRIIVKGDVHLILADGSVLNAQGGGITVADDDTTLENGSPNSLTIYGQSTGKTMGILYASGGLYQSGIGGGNNSAGGTITINGGEVHAVGYGSGAGIGGGHSGAGGTITINGGIVSATGSNDGAGIGGGCYREGGIITINGGKVTAYGGRETGAGIGGGHIGNGGTITINGGNVTAYGGKSGAGIGGGNKENGGNITINGGNVTAIGGTSSYVSGAGIGGGNNGNGGNITINGGNVTAIGGESGAGIGGAGSGGSGTFITGGNGHAVIVASSISDKDDTTQWSGVIFDGDNGQVYGSPVPTEDFEIPAGKTLTIPQGTRLTVPVVLINNGVIKKHGELLVVEGGSLGGNGLVQGPSALTVGVEWGSSEVDTVAYGSTVTLKAAAQAVPASDALLLSAEAGKVNFYLGGVDGTLLGTADVQTAGSIAVAIWEVTLTGESWKPSDTPYTITADFGGSASPGLLESTTTTALTVQKASQTAPDAPTASAQTDNSITLNAVTGGAVGVEYKRGDGAWQTSNVFTGLEAGTPYEFRVRYTGNDYYEESIPSTNATIHTAWPKPTVEDSCQIDYEAETAAAKGHCEISTNGSTWDNGTIPVMPGDTLYARRAGSTNGPPASESVTVVLPTRSSAPTGTEACSIDTGTEQITVTAGYEVNTNSDFGSSTNLTSGTSIDPGTTLYARKAATDSSFKSEAQTVTTPSREATPSVTINYTAETLSTTTAMEYNMVASGQSVPSWQDCTGENMAITAFGWDGTADVKVQFRTKATNSTYASQPQNTFTIPARPAAPAAPTVAKRTNDSITVQTVDGQEYKLDNGEWQGGGEFTGLAAGQTYTIYTRMKVVATISPAFTSAASTGTQTKTVAADGSVTVKLHETVVSGGTTITNNGEKITIEKDGTTTTVTSPNSGGNVNVNEGAVIVPNGSTVQTGDGPELTLTHGGAVAGGGSVTADEVKVGDTTVTGAGTIVTPEGTVSVPNGGTVQTGDSPTITLPSGGTVNEDGGITVPEGGTVTIPGEDGATTTITPPTGSKVNPNSNGTISIPESSTVQTGTGPEITVGPGNGGAVGGDGGVTVPGGGSVQVGDATITLPSGGTVKPNPDGTIPLPGGATVEKGGATITVPAAGGTYHPGNGTVTENVRKVTFNSQGGSAVTPATVSLGGTVTRPADPTRSGYTFGGWYTEADCTNAWNFTTDAVTGDITLYAKWTQNSSSGGGSSSPNYYSRTLTDKAIGVTVKGERIANNAVLTVEKDKLHDSGDHGCDLLRNARETRHVLSVYDVSLSGQYSGSLTVTLPVEGKNGQTVTVAHCIGGVLQLSDVNAIKGTVSIDTDSLSPFAVLDGTYTVDDLKAMTGETVFPFTDVKESDWYYSPVAYVYENGLMVGTTKTTFSPDAATTRGMVVTILWRQAGAPVADYALDFTDVASDAYYAEAVRWAVSQGVAAGYGNGLFGPDDPITREQFAAILYRCAGSPAIPERVLDFIDAEQISPYAEDTLRWAVSEGLISGKGGGILDPQGEATRAQTAAMLMRYYQ